MNRATAALLFIASWLGLAAVPAQAETPGQAHAKASMTQQQVAYRPLFKPATARPEATGSDAEARLIAIYKLIGQADTRQALHQAERLVQGHPTFQLAQLVYGDLLASRGRPSRAPGDMIDANTESVAPALAELRRESLLRLRALRERPPPGSVPSQFLALSPRTRHAIAIDASRSRLYLFENTAVGLALVADYYISLGKSGKTGGGIWLHGTPSAQFSRAPLSTDGCVALANPDLERLINTVEIGSTPVVIAHSLKWLAPQSLKPDAESFEAVLQRWHRTKSSGDLAQLSAWYTSDFTSYGKTLAQWTPDLQAELRQLRGRAIEIKDVSYLRWTDSADTMVVTFGELIKGASTGRTKRQYWTRQGTQWKIFFEGVV